MEVFDKAPIQNTREGTCADPRAMKGKTYFGRNLDPSPDKAGPSGRQSLLKRWFIAVRRENSLISRERARPLVAETHVQTLEQVYHRFVGEHSPAMSWNLALWFTAKVAE